MPFMIRLTKAAKSQMQNIIPLIIIIIMVIFQCYFSREHIALSYIYKNGVNIELGRTNRLIALCMMKDHA